MRLKTDGINQTTSSLYSTLLLFISLTFAALSAFNAMASSKAPAKQPATGLQQEQQEQYVVLISLDGFRHDYIELHNAKHLRAIAEQGVRASSMTPVYPSNTFPNHISLITGLLPKHHGIVNNRFFDKSRPTKEGYAQYKLGYGGMDSTWITATPLWNLVEYHGMKAATFFWPESDSRISGTLPSYFYHYSKYSDYQQRVDQIITWLKLPEVSRPRFIAGYFSLTDSVGHDEGPFSDKTSDAVAKVDALIGQLYERINALDLPVNLVVVSDHGMTPVDENMLIEVESLSIPENFIFENEGAQVHLYAREGVSDEHVANEIERLNRIASNRYIVLNDKQRAKRHMELGNRTGDIILEIAPPARFIDANSMHISKGGHGYVNTLPDMGATFVAVGPAFKPNTTLPVFSNLEVYPALAKILGIAPITPIDGKLKVLEQALTL
ncbi:ectonucleotide pyrophosphatase/phosphodiesterase [Alteromonas abrolhosensis]|uniref:alkaline phosphatase family protein n=1 Tax=Alteromonas abrolhosensis TaxID=1892904 RepID=UPI003BAC8B0C